MTTTNDRRGEPSRTRKHPGSDHVETEWQFESDDLAATEEWLKGRPDGPVLFIEPQATREIRDTYFDTEDWRVHRAGYALRVRETDGAFEATMKALASEDEDGARRRREVSMPLKDAGSLTKKTSGLVGERLRNLTGPSREGRELRPLFEVRTRRSVFELRRAMPDVHAETTVDASGDVRPRTSGERATRIGELSLDASEIITGDEKMLLRRVEVEATEGDAARGEVSLLWEFAEQISEALGLVPAVGSKYEVGLDFAGLIPAPAPDFGSTDIERSSTIGELAFAALREQFSAMLVHEPGTRLGEDPEALHDMRVATRRMRVAMKLFESALPERCQWFREELKSFAGALGEVRDLDVLLEDTMNRTSGTTGEDRESLGKILEALERERVKAREEMLEALDSERYERYERFSTYLAAMLREGPEDGEETATPAAVAGRGVISTARRKWLKAAKRLRKNSPSEAYHDLRKKGKRLRYALEFLSVVNGTKATARLVKPLKKVQDVLGEQQDASVAAETLRGLAASRRRFSRAAVYTMGTLAERRLREAEASRSGFRRSGAFKTLTKGPAWKDFDKKTKDIAKTEAKKSSTGKAGG